MNTGVQCKSDPDCHVPAPFSTRICHVHTRQARLAAMQRSPSASVRAVGRVLSRLAGHQAEHEAGA